MSQIWHWFQYRGARGFIRHSLWQREVNIFWIKLYYACWNQDTFYWSYLAVVQLLEVGFKIITMNVFRFFCVIYGDSGWLQCWRWYLYDIKIDGYLWDWLCIVWGFTHTNKLLCVFLNNRNYLHILISYAEECNLFNVQHWKYSLFRTLL